MKKVLIVFSDVRCSCTRKCTFELSKGLSNFAKVKTMDYLLLTEDHFRKFDIIIFQRLGANGVIIKNDRKEFILSNINKYKKDKNKIMIYHIDDLIINRQGGTPIDFIKTVDSVIVTSEYYIKYIIPHNPNIHILRTFIDTNYIHSIKDDLLLEKNKLKILWASTGGLGKEFMRSLVPALSSKFKNCIVYCVERSFGYNSRKVSFLPFDAFIKYFKACDIILNPVFSPDSEINGYNSYDYLNCKSEIKYLDAGITKTPIISSPIYNFNYAIKNKVNGLLVKANIEEWVNAVDLLVNDTFLKKNIIDNAYHDVINNYSLKSAGKKLNEIIEEIYKGKK